MQSLLAAMYLGQRPLLYKDFENTNMDSYHLQITQNTKNYGDNRFKRLLHLERRKIVIRILERMPHLPTERWRGRAQNV